MKETGQQQGGGAPKPRGQVTHLWFSGGQLRNPSLAGFCACMMCVPVVCVCQWCVYMMCVRSVCVSGMYM